MGARRSVKIQTFVALVAAALVAMTTVSGVLAYDFPSTNEENRENGNPHVQLLSQDLGEVTLEFVNDTNSLAFFEYRVDGEELESGSPHPVVTDDYIHPGVTVDGRGEPDPVIVTDTFEADKFVEVRLALGGERNWDFDWVTFEVLSDAQTKRDCKKGGYEDFGFKNQGQCIKFVNTGKDSR